MPIWPGFIGPSYRSVSVMSDIERLVNLYLAKIDTRSARNPFALFPTPGFSPNPFAMLGSAPIRGLFGQTITTTQRAWVVGDQTLAEFFADGTFTPRSTTLLRDANPVTMVTNGAGGNQLFVTSGGHKYILDLVTGVVTDQGAGATSDVIMGDMLDGFFLALEADRYAISDDFNGTSWNGLQFLERSSQSDPWKALKVVRGRIYLLGEFTSDVHYNVGTSPFPFAPIQGASIQQGTAAPFSAVDFKGTLVWLAQNRKGDRTFQQASAYSAQKISDHGVDYQLSKYQTVNDAEAFSVEIFGTEHYICNFPTENKSWGYTDEGGWYELGTWNPTRNDYDVWHPRCHAFVFGQHYVGDRASDAIYTMSPDFGYDVGGAALRRLRIAPVLGSMGEKVPIKNFTLLMDNGLGLASGQGADPTISLSRSKNAGKTWGAERWRHVGAGGDYKHVVRWHRLGSGRNQSVKIVMTDPVPLRIVNALINDDLGTVA